MAKTSQDGQSRVKGAGAASSAEPRCVADMRVNWRRNTPTFRFSEIALASAFCGVVRRP